MTAPQRAAETGLIRKQAIAHNSDYGETTQLSGSATVYNPFLYTGQELDKETGFYHLRARHYAPSLGKFLSRDPIGYGGGSNLYSYCGGDPINCVDPDGLEVRWRVRVQKGPMDVGHSWIEVSDPKSPGGFYSIGPYFGPGLQSPEPAVNELAKGLFPANDFKTVKTYKTSPKQDADFVVFLKAKLVDAKKNPSNYYQLGKVPGTGVPGTHSIKKSKVCTTTSAKLLKEGKIDPQANDQLLQPNDLYNYYNPKTPVAPGPIPITVVP